MTRLEDRTLMTSLGKKKKTTCSERDDSGKCCPRVKEDEAKARLECQMK